ncbi:MAG: hypothetical protein IPH82_21725 [Chloroflexi bacterium]|nr:hypothetical protein [Chloroflexota bacterium]
MKRKQIQPEKTLHEALSSIKSLTSTPKPNQTINDDEFVPACQFVTQLVSQMHEYGVSSIRLQDLMSQLPQLFGFHGAMLVAPIYVALVLLCCYQRTGMMSFLPRCSV